MKTDGDCFCPVEDLRRFIQRCFRRIGLNNTDADFIADSIIASELAGHACHGVRRLPEYLMRW